MNHNKLSESVIMPREDFIELSTVAFDNHHVPSFSERAGQTLQTTFVAVALAAAWSAGAAGYYALKDWQMKRQHDREMDQIAAKARARTTI